MKSTPSEAGRAGSRTELSTDPGSDLSGHLQGEVAARTPERRAEHLASPTLVIRARIQWRLPALVLPVVGVLLFVVGWRWGAAIVVLAAPSVPAFWIRIEMADNQIRRRSWRRRWRTVELEPIDALRLRRLAFPVLAWLPRGRIGRFWSVPLTMRLLHEGTISLELRCVWWNGWREIARYVAALPGIELDARTRGRLGRYVGPIAFAPPAHP